MPLMAIETRYSTAPTVTDDVSKGYGDRWLWEDQVTGNVYKCLNNSVGAAVWVVMSTASGNTPLIGQPTRTTSTVGYLGQVIFDTDGNEWKLIKIIESAYYWALPRDCFPVDNTEYLFCFEGSVPTHKYRVTFSTVITSPLIIAHGRSIAKPKGIRGWNYVGGVYNRCHKYSYAGAGDNWSFIFNTTNLLVTFSAAYNNTNGYQDLYYTKP